MANIIRVDLGEFIFFINIFSGKILAHEHDDLLSYVIYYKGREILIDPGMPTYLKPNDYSRNYQHNGIWCNASMLRPTARFFVPHEFYNDAIELNLEKESRIFYARAKNKFSKHERQLTFKQTDFGIDVRETYMSHRSNEELGFTHCFADNSVYKISSKEVNFSGLNFVYGSDLTILPLDRALAYGEPRRACQICSRPIGNSIIWRIFRAS